MVAGQNHRQVRLKIRPLGEAAVFPLAFNSITFRSDCE
jgi:hypothetical protein